MAKGLHTRTAILDQALDLASEVGLEGLSIGTLAKRAGMSKSGLYAHFDAKEDLQCRVLDAAAERFTEVVLKPAFAQPRGLPRIRTMFDRWLEWGVASLSGGCLFIAASTEFDDRQGTVRENLVGHLSRMLEMVARSARFATGEGHFRGDLDCEQFACEYWGILLAHHNLSRLLNHPQAEERTRRAFAGLIERSLAA